MAKVLYTWFTKLTLLKFGLELVLSQSLENKPHMVFMFMFSGTEHKYIFQVYKHKVTNILSERLLICIMLHTMTNKTQCISYTPNKSKLLGLLILLV